MCFCMMSFLACCHVEEREVLQVNTELSQKAEELNTSKKELVCLFCDAIFEISPIQENLFSICLWFHVVNFSSFFPHIGLPSMINCVTCITAARVKLLWKGMRAAIFY